MNPKMLVSMKLVKSSLYTKCLIDSLLVALALGAIVSAGFEKQILARCRCMPECLFQTANQTETCNATCLVDRVNLYDEYGVYGAQCEYLKACKISVLVGGLLLMFPKVLSSIELSWVTRKAWRGDGKVVYMKGTEELFIGAFSDIPCEDISYSGFFLRALFACGNMILFVVSIFEVFVEQGPKRWKLLGHYIVSIPSACLPCVLVVALVMLVREARSPVECLAYAGSIQIFAFLGSILTKEILNREAAIGSALISCTFNPGSDEQLLNWLATILLKADQSKEVAVIKFNPEAGRDERDYVLVVYECLKYMKGIPGIIFDGFTGDGIFELVVKMKERMEPNCKFEFTRSRFLANEIEALQPNLVFGKRKNLEDLRRKLLWKSLQNRCYQCR